MRYSVIDPHSLSLLTVSGAEVVLEGALAIRCSKATDTRFDFSQNLRWSTLKSNGGPFNVKLKDAQAVTPEGLYSLDEYGRPAPSTNSALAPILALPNRFFPVEPVKPGDKWSIGNPLQTGDAGDVVVCYVRNEPYNGVVAARFELLGDCSADSTRVAKVQTPPALRCTWLIDPNTGRILMVEVTDFDWREKHTGRICTEMRYLSGVSKLKLVVEVPKPHKGLSDLGPLSKHISNTRSGSVLDARRRIGGVHVESSKDSRF
jgi:hypothetical protein